MSEDETPPRDDTNDMSQDKFQILFDRSSDPHIIFDATGITDCNDAMIRLLGAPDKSWVLALHPAALSPEFQPDGRRSVHFPSGGPARVVKSCGFPVGIFEEATFEELRITLGRGDRLYLYSDGLPEAMAPGGVQFGKQRLLNAVVAGASETLDASVARLQAEVLAWCGEDGPQDDLSILAIEIGAPG